METVEISSNSKAAASRKKMVADPNHCGSAVVEPDNSLHRELGAFSFHLYVVLARSLINSLSTVKVSSPPGVTCLSPLVCI